jgi:GNAT superfamily N-acetyltransferase
VLIRFANAAELPTLLEVERRAGVRLADVPELRHLLDDVSDLTEVGHAQENGLVWAAEVDGEIVGWCYASVVDDSLFVEEVDVVPEHGRRGIGRALLDAVSHDAEARGLAAVTLTTDTHLAFNRPLYEKLGFVVLAPDQLGPGLRAAIAREAERGLDLGRRVAMRRPTSVLRE